MNYKKAFFIYLTFYLTFCSAILITSVYAAFTKLPHYIVQSENQDKLEKLFQQVIEPQLRKGVWQIHYKQRELLFSCIKDSVSSFYAKPYSSRQQILENIILKLKTASSKNLDIGNFREKNSERDIFSSNICLDYIKSRKTLEKDTL